MDFGRAFTERDVIDLTRRYIHSIKTNTEGLPETPQALIEYTLKDIDNWLWVHSINDMQYEHFKFIARMVATKEIESWLP